MELRIKRQKLKGESKKASEWERSVLFFTHFTLLTCLILILTACNESFQPLQENDGVAFSIYGYLDASADTQWVRVTPIREQLDQPPVKPEMHVTLEHLESGSKTVMNDSLFLFNDGFNILNAWTVADIEPGQTYRLRAERRDGAASHVTVTIPGEFPEPVLQDIGDGCRATMLIEGVERLADVQSKWHIRLRYIDSGKVILDEERLYSFPYRNKTDRTSAVSYSVFINTNSEEEQLRNQLSPTGVQTSIEVLGREIFVAAGGPEWDEEITSLDDILYALPESFSNVETGVGYMVGIVSRSLTYESCFEN